jgi:hypothetical protein
MRRAWLVGWWVLAGCPSVGPGEWNDVRDQDGDGGIAVRFGGPDCVDDDRRYADCDEDGDGLFALAVGGTDCDDGDDTIGERTWYRDGDLDGHGDPAIPAEQCEVPPGFVASSDDCDPEDGTIHPEAEETCDAADRDCTGDPYDVDAPPAWFTDDDGDGFGVGSVTGAGCVPPRGMALRTGDCDDDAPQAHEGAVEVFYDGVDGDCLGGNDFDQDADGALDPSGGGTDCNDRDPAVFEGAPEQCNGVDDDCDGSVDEGSFPDDTNGAAPHHADADGDGFGDPSAPTAFHCLDVPDDGWVLDDTDCDDSAATVSPVGSEVCNNLDDDCNGVTDDNASDTVTLYLDADGDTWGSTAVEACGLVQGLTDNDDDCDDADPASHPGAVEVCGDDFRQDCSALAVDDCDGDGSSAPADCLDDPVDSRARSVYPGAVEVCDGFDNDCDGLSDAEELTNPFQWPDWYVDLDGDGFGGSVLAVSQTCTPPPFAVPNQSDCDDGRAAVNPDAREVCDGLDNDCAGGVDDVAAQDLARWYDDDDGDGFGAGVARRSCVAPPGHVALPGDCDDANDAVSPIALETCAPGDEDCDGLADQADPSVDGRVYADEDGDGAGNPSVDQPWCALPPAGWSADPSDCDDGDGAVSPSATEVCNGLDDDCDTLVDDADPFVTQTTSLFPDRDDDGFGDEAASVERCDATGYVAVGGDCADDDRDTYPGAPERCAAGDENCDGVEETSGPDVLGQTLGFVDADADGFGDPGSLQLGCGLAPALITQAGDCDDTDAARNPGAPEATCDGEDSDCNGVIDDVDPVAYGEELGALRWVADRDGDGFSEDSRGRAGCFPVAGELPFVDALPEDCDDTDPYSSPSLSELCDGVDNDCNGSVDDGVVDGVDLYEDGDGDGLGGSNRQRVCPGPGWVTSTGDCNDWRIDIQFGDVFCVDADGDGRGDPENCAQDCSLPAGSTPLDQADDCDDTQIDDYPGAPEIACDGRDNDCDALTTDEADGVPLYADVDRDGFGDPDVPLTVGCPGPGEVVDTTDCDDLQADVYPGAPEVCDTQDNDCDFAIDEDGCLEKLWWPDADGDTYGDPNAPPVRAAVPPAGRVGNALDCSDLIPGDVVTDAGSPYSDGVALATAWGGDNRPCVLYTVDSVTPLSLPASLTTSSIRKRRLASAGAAPVTFRVSGSQGFAVTDSSHLVLQNLVLDVGGGGAPLAQTGSTANTLVLAEVQISAVGKAFSLVTQSSNLQRLLTAGIQLDQPLGNPTFVLEGDSWHWFDLISGPVQVFSDPGQNLYVEGTSFVGIGSVGATNPLLTPANIEIRDSDIDGQLDLGGYYATTLVEGVRVTAGDPGITIDNTYANVTLQDVVVSGATSGIVAAGDDGSLYLNAVTVSDVTGVGLELSCGSFNNVSVDFTDLEILRAGGTGFLNACTPLVFVARDVRILEPGGNGFESNSSQTIDGLLVTGAGGNGVVGQVFLNKATIVGSALDGAQSTYAGGSVVDSIIVGSGNRDLRALPGSYLYAYRTSFGSRLGNVWSSSYGTPAVSAGAPVFVRAVATDPPDTWDLQLHPLDVCNGIDTASATSGPIGYYPARAPVTSSDLDSIADGWELAWFGDLTTASDTSNGGADLDAYDNCFAP